MKFEQLKQEITQLSALVEGWQQSGYAVEIERDLALEKVRKIYNTLRFEVCCEPVSSLADSDATVAAAVAAVAENKSIQNTQENEETDFEPDFEIEFIMPEEGEESEENELSATEEEEADEIEEEVDEKEFSDNEYTDEDDDEEGDYNDGDEELEPIVEPTPEPEVIDEPVAEPEVEAIPEPEPAPQSEPTPAPQPESAPQLGFEQSLFGMETTPRTAPRRRSILMSLYDDTPHAEKLHPQKQTTSAPEKSPAEPFAADFGKRASNPYAKPDTVPSTATPPTIQKEDAAAHTATPRAVIHVQEPVIATLADTDVEAVLGEVLMPERQTLGDTISPTQTVAESAPVKSLRSSISVADRFMLARTLFGGDDAAFDQAIEELDSFDDFDNCIIHITENYSWPPASEGAKMIIELLQRKFL